jgi:hypothetical protein
MAHHAIHGERGRQKPEAPAFSFRVFRGLRGFTPSPAATGWLSKPDCSPRVWGVNARPAGAVMALSRRDDNRKNTSPWRNLSGKRTLVANPHRRGVAGSPKRKRGEELHHTLPLRPAGARLVVSLMDRLTMTSSLAGASGFLPLAIRSGSARSVESTPRKRGRSSHASANKRLLVKGPHSGVPCSTALRRPRTRTESFCARTRLPCVNHPLGLAAVCRGR